MQVDPETHPNIDAFRAAARAEGLNTVFHQQSNLVCPIEDTDLLFIDTWHVYAQLKRELHRWHSHVKKYIIMHDTTVDEWYGETLRCGHNANAATQSRETGFPIHEITKGLWPAIAEFLSAHPEWKIRERFVNNNGLTVLERVGHS